MSLPLHRSFFFAMLIVVSFSVFGEPQGPVIGTVTLKLGNVLGIDQDGDTFLVERGTELHAGYTLETTARAFVRMEMNDGTRMTLGQNGSTTLEEFSFNQSASTGGFKTTVRRGGFKYKSGLLANVPRRVHSTISTPNGVIGVRGTEIEAVLEADGRLTINIPVGNVDITFTRSDGSTYTQSVGVSEPIQIVQVSRDGTFEGLENVPQNLRNAITVLAEQVDEAVQAAEVEDNSTTDNGSDDDAETNPDDNTDTETTPDPKTTPDDTQPQDQNLTFDTDTQTLTPTPTPASGGGATQDIIDSLASPSTRQPGEN